MKKFQKFVGICALSTTLLVSTVSIFGRDKKDTDDVDYSMLQQKLIGNYNSSYGSDYITRAEFVVLVNDTFRIKYTVYNPFGDVSKKEKYYDDILAARREGYIYGDEENKFYPNREITRAEVAEMISVLIEREDVLLNRVHIADIDEMTREVAYDVNNVVANGIMKLDSDNKFNPDELVTVDEAFGMLSRVIDAGYITPRADEVFELYGQDGYELYGRVTYPANVDKVEKLVINVNGSGLHDYLLTVGDSKYDYYVQINDLFAEEFISNDTAFFSYSTRGIDNIQDVEPYYTVNDDHYEKYTPKNNARDLKIYIDKLRSMSVFEDSEIYLLGWSEGTITAPHAIVDEYVDVDGLILVGYCNYNLKDYIEYQTNGKRDFELLAKYAGKEGATYFTKKDYMKLSPDLIYAFFGGSSFEEIDLNNDYKISEDDFIIAKRDYYYDLRDAFKYKDEEYIRENYFDAHIEWFNGHFEYGDNINTMKEVYEPIYILDGTFDASIPNQDALDAKETFEWNGKNNLTVEFFEGADHNLDLAYWASTNVMSEGIERIFDIVENEFEE